MKRHNINLVWYFLAFCAGMTIGVFSFYVFGLKNTPELFWTALGAIATLSAAIFTWRTAIWTRKAAEAARDTVKEMVKEKEDERKRSLPKISIGSVWMEESNSGIFVEQLIYKASVNNLNDSKLRYVKAVVAIFPLMSNCNYVSVSRLISIHLHGRVPEFVEMPCYLNDPNIKNTDPHKVYYFLKAEDVFDNEVYQIIIVTHYSKALTKELLESENWDRFKIIDENKKERQHGNYTLDDPVNMDDIEMVLKNVGNYDLGSDAVYDFLYSFPDIKMMK